MAQGYCTINCDFLKLPALVNSSFSKLSSIYLILLHHLLPAEFIIDKLLSDAFLKQNFENNLVHVNHRTGMLHYSLEVPQ